MAKGQYIGVNNVARKVTKQYIGVNNIARKVTKGYIGVGNVARQCYAGGTPIGELEVGTSVYMNIDGVPTEFFVVQQGNPDATIYDSSCDGTWLLMKHLLNETKYYASLSATASTQYNHTMIHSYLSGDFVNRFDSNIQDIIKQVKIPYFKRESDVTKFYISSGANGLSVKAFLLSYTEVGCTGSTNVLVEGVALDYFDQTPNSKRIAYVLPSTAKPWMIRTPCKNATNKMFYITEKGGTDEGFANFTGHYRPALILPSEVLVDDKFNVTT